MKNSIGISTVIGILKTAKKDFKFTIEYRTIGKIVGGKSTGGRYGQKYNVTKRVEYDELKSKSQSSLGAIKREVQNASQLYLLDAEGLPFNVYICNVVSFNGKIIDHEK